MSQPAITLGLHTGHESSAVLFEGRRLVAAVSDERITRIKNDGGRLMRHAMDSVFGIANRAQGDAERLACLLTFFPEEYFVRETWAKELERRLVRKRRARRGERPQMFLENFIERLAQRKRSFDAHFKREAFLHGEGFAPGTAIAFFDHHDAHAIAAAYYSGFGECAVVTMDGVGDRHINHTNGVFRHGRYERGHASDGLGSSAGLFYGHITELLGFRPMRHEGKVVGLAAMGKPEPLRSAFARALRLGDDGVTLTSDFVGRAEAEKERFAYLASQIRGHSREDVSAAAQETLEEVVVALVRNYLRQTGLRQLALNGGVFANVKLNQRLAALPEVDALFVFPAMSDTGNSVGAALMDLQSTDPEALADGEPLKDVYLGPEYSDEAIAAALAEAGLSAVRLGEEDLTEKAAAAIHAGRIVGWFQGRMEFGPRALGNRSMLARPIKSDINDWLNKRLDRSEFMPFAPSVLAEAADDIFVGVDKARHAAEFMTVTFDVKPEWRERIPAVIHVDGTARPQLVRKDRNRLYHRLIEAYRKLSGLPLVLNTSFNVHEEPIVCAPPEAIRAFVEKRVDCLAMGSYWLEHA